MRTKILGTHDKLYVGAASQRKFRKEHEPGARYVAPGEEVALQEGMITYVQPLCGEGRSEMFRKVPVLGVMRKVGPFLVQPLGDVTVTGPAMIGEPAADSLERIRKTLWEDGTKWITAPCAIMVAFYVFFCLSEFARIPLLAIIGIPAALMNLAFMIYSDWQEFSPKVVDGEDFPGAMRKGAAQRRNLVPAD